MNPKAKGITFLPFPPLAEVRRKLHVNWYRCPIERTRLRALSQPSDALGAFQALGHLALLAVTGLFSCYLFEQQLWWGFFLALFAHGTVASFLTAPHHELCHGTVFRTKWLNRFFLRVFSLLGWFNFHVYKFSHSYHHRFTLFPQADREEVLPVTPSLRILFLLQLFTINITGGYQSRGVIPTLNNFVDLSLDRFHNPFNSWGEELYADQAKERAKARHWARLVIAFHTAVIVIAIGSGHPIVAVIVSGGVFIANWHRYFVGVPMHCGLRSNVSDFRKCVRTITLDPVTEFLYWHMNWHLEHHMYAAVPCYHLKALHQSVAPDMPEPRTLMGAWTEMRKTWMRQCEDPAYEFDTPVPSFVATPADEADPLASSIGDLAPRSLAEETPTTAMAER